MCTFSFCEGLQKKQFAHLTFKWLTVQDGGNPPLSAFTKVSIAVRSRIDETPIFGNTPINFVIQDSQSNVITIICSVIYFFLFSHILYRYRNHLTINQVMCRKLETYLWNCGTMRMLQLELIFVPVWPASHEFLLPYCLYSLSYWRILNVLK